MAQLSARGDVELAECASQVRLDRLFGDEQRLGNLTVCGAARGKLGDASLARRQRIYAPPRRRTGPNSNRCKLVAHAALEHGSAASRGLVERFEQRFAGRAALTRRPESRTDIGEHAGVLKTVWRLCEYVARSGQPVEPFCGWLHECLGAQGDADGAVCSEVPRPPVFL
jgi:hypothetical protein